MNKEVKALWIAALRSGEYKQGAGRLGYTQDGVTKHCCLGVLCELAVKAGVIETTEVRNTTSCPCGCDGWEDTGLDVKLYAGSKSYLPASVQAWAQIGENGELSKHMSYDSGYNVTWLETLAQVNDTRKFSFGTIADIIEEQF